MTRKVIDVSAYQGVIDWDNVKSSGIEGAILKIIRGDLKPDARFEDNWRGCLETGMPVIGVYNYSYATDEKKALRDAKGVISILAGRDAKVWLDVEDASLRDLDVKLIHIIKTYRDAIEDAGLSFGVYTGLSFYNNFIKPWAHMLDCHFWIARYPSNASMPVSKNPPDGQKPSIAHKLAGWQYSSKGKVPGISGNVDMDLWYEADDFFSTVHGGLDYAPVFDAVYYADRYPDLKAAFGYDEAALFRHFITFGMREGRQASEAFNVFAYRDRYPDLREAFGDDLPLYYQHYLRFGRHEKRNPL